MKVLLIVAALCVASNLVLGLSEEQLTILLAGSMRCMKTIGADQYTVNTAIATAINNGTYDTSDVVQMWAGCHAVQNLHLLTTDGSFDEAGARKLCVDSLKFTQAQFATVIENCNPEDLPPTNEQKLINQRAFNLVKCFMEETKKLPKEESR